MWILRKEPNIQTLLNSGGVLPQMHSLEETKILAEVRKLLVYA